MKKPLGIIDFAAAGLVAVFIHSGGHAASGGKAMGETTPRDWTARIAASAFHTCQLNHDGTVRCWGDNSSGQLGDGTTTSNPSPVTVSGISNAVAIASVTGLGQGTGVSRIARAAA
jgi:alpha-tubulin suppressor-like RCC1 family protein